MNNITLMKFIIVFVTTSCSHQGNVSYQRNPASWDSCYKELESIFKHPSVQNSALDPVYIQEAGDLSQLERAYGEESFFSWQARLSNKDIGEMNQKTLELLNGENIPTGVKTWEKPSLNSVKKEQAQILYQDMQSSPCVTNHHKYDRPGVSLGYCFGRATMAHMAAIVRGINPKSVKKIWVVGEMYGGWGHHVAAMVRAQDNKWYVIDNVSGLVTHDQWMNKFKGMKKNKDVLFFVTSANRFGPENTDSYNPINLFNVHGDNFEDFSSDDDYYRGFFHDLFKWIDDHPEQFQRFQEE